MKEYKSELIRNITLVSHSSAGKTMLAEAMLHLTGVTNRLGKIEDGTTASDYEEEEIRKGISLSTAVIPIEYNEHKINFLDTPGFNDFVGEMISALRVSDGAIVVLDSVSGVEVGTEIAWSYCDEFKLPRFLLINKMDRENANFSKALNSMQEISTKRLIPVQLPWGEKQDFKGVIDLLTTKAYEGSGESAQDIPDEFTEQVDAARMELIEAAAEGEDALLEKYLEGEQLNAEEIMRGLKKVVLTGDFVPVLVAAGGAEIGLAPLLKAAIDLMPSPVEAATVIAKGKGGDEELQANDASPLSAYVWKTTADQFVGRITYFRVYSGLMASDTRVWNQSKETQERLGTISIIRGKDLIGVKNLHAGDIGTVLKLNETATGDTLCDRGHPLSLPVPDYPNALYQVAVSPKTQADSAKVTPTLSKLSEEDMTLSWHQEPSTKQTILQGMGDQHIDVAIRKAEKKFQTGLDIQIPKVAYQETITKTGSDQYRHKKQTGGAGQFGEVHLRIEPLEDEEFKFVNEVFGGSISSSYMTAIEKGIRNTMRDGVLAGYQVVNVLAAVIDGKEHPVDSKPIAFEIAAREVFKLAFKAAGPVLLEPIMHVRITVPEASMGDVLGDLNTRRARVQGMDTDKGRSVVTAHVPMAEMQRYTTELRSITGGRGVFSMEFAHYEQLPSNLAQEVVEARQREQTEEKE